MNDNTEVNKVWLEFTKLLLLTLCEFLTIFIIFFIRNRLDRITTSFILSVVVLIAMLAFLSYAWFKWIKSYKEYKIGS